ncbi:MAG: hypothetical protein ACRDHW_02775, partial [Ktedonobacteraceae bacterium]
MQIIKRRSLMSRVRRRVSHQRNGALALVMTLFVLLGAAFYQVPRAHAGTTSPIIHWDSTMVYPGQNNGNPEGPVGEIAVVQGVNFTAGQQLKLILVAGNSVSNATLCPTGGKA